MVLKRVNGWLNSALGQSTMIMVYAAVTFALCSIAYFRMDPTENASAPLIAGMLQVFIFGLAARLHARGRRGAAIASTPDSPHTRPLDPGAPYRPVGVEVGLAESGVRR
jgi:hypothetical protein